jgi:hypothetical protein
MEIRVGRELRSPRDQQVATKYRRESSCAESPNRKGVNTKKTAKLIIWGEGAANFGHDIREKDGAKSNPSFPKGK